MSLPNSKNITESSTELSSPPNDFEQGQDYSNSEAGNEPESKLEEDIPEDKDVKPHK